MSTRTSASSFSPPVPELPVADVERAQQHYRWTTWTATVSISTMTDSLPGE